LAIARIRFENSCKTCRPTEVTHGTFTTITRKCEECPADNNGAHLDAFVFATLGVAGLAHIAHLPPFRLHFIAGSKIPQSHRASLHALSSMDPIVCYAIPAVTWISMLPVASAIGLPTIWHSAVII